jgi:hypothetical protein
MFGSVLVTATLLDAFEFAVNAPPSWQVRADKGFISKIKREKATYPIWVDAGMQFEDTVYRVCESSETKEQALEHGSDMFKEVVAQCYGGSFQNKLSKNLQIGDNKAFFFGFTDVDFDDKTIDLKTCIKWKNEAKYLNKAQHKLYLWMNGKPNFEYVVTEWADQELCNTIKSNHIIKYTSPGTKALEGEIVRRTQAMFEYIHSEGLWEDYYFTFSKN